MNNPRILVQISQTKFDPWASIFINGQLPTFILNNNNPNIKFEPYFGKKLFNIFHKIEFFVSGYRSHKYISRILYKLEKIVKFGISDWIPRYDRNQQYFNYPGVFLHMPDMSLLGSHKTLGALNASLEVDYEYLVQICTSTYLNLENLSSKLAKLPKTGLISGRFISGNEALISGSFRIFSREIVEYVVNNHSACDHGLLEDISISRLLENYPAIRVSLDIADVSSVSDLRQLTKDQLENVVAFRCKSGSLKSRHDVEIMTLLHSALYFTRH